MSTYKKQQTNVAVVYLRQGGDDYAQRESDAVNAIVRDRPGIRVRVASAQLWNGELARCDAVYTDGWLPEGAEEKYGPIAAVSASGQGLTAQELPGKPDPQPAVAKKVTKKFAKKTSSKAAD